MSTHRVAEFVQSLSYDALPANVISKVKWAILDHVGIMLGSVHDQAVETVRRMAVAQGGRPDSTLLCDGHKVPANLAAMVGAVMARTLDFDDGAYRKQGHMTHAGGLTVPSVLAVAEKQHASGREMIAAAAASYEVSLRAGWIVSLWPLFAPAGMAGGWGTAAATAKLMRFDVQRIRHALGIAEAHCVMPSRAKTFPKTMMTKEAEGWGAMTGVSAALLAEAGFEGPETIFDLAQYSTEPLASLGTGWELLSLYFKPYPCCRFTHATVDGIDQLMREHKLVRGDIAGVTLGVAKAPVKMFSNYRPHNIWQAQFSLPYVAGVKINDGVVWLDQFTPARLKDPAVLAWVDKVEVAGDDEADAFRPGGVATRITLKTVDGRKLETFIAYPKGAPENPLTEKELEAKFTGLVSRTFGERVAGELLNQFLNLEKLADYTELAARLGQPVANK